MRKIAFGCIVNVAGTVSLLPQVVLFPSVSSVLARQTKRSRQAVGKARLNRSNPDSPDSPDNLDNLDNLSGIQIGI